MIALLLVLLAQEQVDKELREDVWNVPPDLLLRARITALTPPEPSSIEWRYLGEGLGGNVVKGKFPAKLFLTFMVGKRGSRGAEVEFEVAWKGQVVKTFKEAGPDGGSIGIVVPAQRLAAGRTPASPEFTRELSGLLDYARRRAERFAPLNGSSLKKIGVVTNLGGYGEGVGYGIRFTNKEVVEAELDTLRRLGVNGFASAPDFLLDRPDFRRLRYAQLGGYPVPSAQKGKDVAEAGCPFAPGVAARTREMVEKGLEAALQMRAQEVWWRTEDEIGAVFDRSPEGKAHPSVCPRCGEAFRDGLHARGLKPQDFGKTEWAEVKPLDLAASREPALAAYETAMFVNRASAGLFTPLRDALARANEETRKGGLQRPLLYSFALRGNTFLMGGHSLDFFDYYRAADNAFVYETSNRDPRVWGWDSYLCDVGRVMAADRGLKFGVYVKPHRGAPIQRALSAVARGASMLYWYTYGPEYVKGDSFAASDEAVALTARAAALLAATEDVVAGASWAIPAEVAVVNPRSSELWMRMSGGSPAPYENAKWIYTALQHAHLPVDPLDEGLLETAALDRYQVIYVSGPNLTRAAAAKLAAWVQAGGTLVTSGGGLARDEADRPLDFPLLGLEARGPVEVFAKIQAYGATKLETWTGSVGREVLRPAPGTEVLARFDDGGASVTRRGRVWVLGSFPGLEYSAAVRADAYDMSRSFDAARRALIAAPALERVKPVVDASEPLVEGVLLRHPASGRRAVVLMNWAYRKTAAGLAPVVFRDLKVSIRTTAGALRSTALGRSLDVVQNGEILSVTLPRLEEGDILLLD